ncbi:nucleotide exchange factor GrpE [Mycoplasma sp. B6188]|uniref:nucleotide exchange factor GrpE n=1 Tax=unclassified Mycoplasma TaxID=2683645 RepID=UPI003AB06043
MNNTKLNVGDIVKGNFTLFVNDEIMTEYTKQCSIELGKEQYLPNFDEYLINRKVKPSLEVKLSFAKNYPIEALAGKNAKVIIEEVQVTYSHHKGHEAKNSKEVENLKAEIETLKAKLAEKEHKILLDEYMYKEKLETLQTKAKEKLEAEQAHLHSKMKHEKAEIKKYALQGFLEDFIEPFNNFLAATNAGANSDNAIVKNYCYGFSIVAKQFTNLLEQHGAFIIQPEVGSEFNPEQEEVLDFVADETKANNTIVRVVRLGLSIDDRLVKPAGVIVVKNS